MIRVMIVSDTHGMNSFVEKQIEHIGENNLQAIIHAGDYVSDAEELEALYPTIPMYNVAGNNDIYTRAKGEDVVTLGGVKIFITHGHSYGVKYDADYRTLISRAGALGADVAVFGHTHIAHLSYRGKLTLVNPGSAGYFDKYAIMEIENGRANIKLF